MNQNKISKETAILFAFFIVGILTIFGVPIWISIIIVFILAISWAYSRKISTPTPATSAPTPSTPAVPILKRINWIRIAMIAGIIIGIAIILSLLYGPMLGYIKFNPYGDGFVPESQTFSHKAEGNITGESGGPNWKSFTAGVGGVNGELYLSDKIETGDCVKINFCANKKEGGKIKIIFRPYEGSPSYRDGAEIEIREEKNTANLCYMASAEKIKAQAQAVVLFDIPENVTATFVRE